MRHPHHIRIPCRMDGFPIRLAWGVGASTFSFPWVCILLNLRVLRIVDFRMLPTDLSERLVLLSFASGLRQTAPGRAGTFSCSRTSGRMDPGPGASALRHELVNGLISFIDLNRIRAPCSGARRDMKPVFYRPVEFPYPGKPLPCRQFEREELAVVRMPAQHQSTPWSTAFSHPTGRWYSRMENPRESDGIDGRFAAGAEASSIMESSAPNHSGTEPCG